MKLITYQPSQINSGKTYGYLNRKNDKKYKHNYVYLIQNKTSLMLYSGLRSCNIEPLDDIGHEYFTSSKYTHFKDNPENWNVWIIKDFDKRSDAACLESSLHKQHNVKNNELFYNRCNSNIYGYDTSGATKYNNEAIAKQGRNLSRYLKKTKARAGKKNAMFGKTGTKCPHYGKKHSKEWKENIRQGNLNKQHPKICCLDCKKEIGIRHISRHKCIHGVKIWKNKSKTKCPHCNFESYTKGNMTRWHFDNCKFKYEDAENIDKLLFQEPLW